MGRYRFWIAFKMQLGVLIKYKYMQALTLQLPFIEIILAFGDDAEGIYFFGLKR